MLLLLNAHHEPLPFALPARRRDQCWELLLDTRLARGLVANFERHAYSAEELVAELCSAFSLGRLNMATTERVEQSADYLNGWARVIGNAPDMIRKATGQATRAVDMILGQ